MKRLFLTLSALLCIVAIEREPAQGAWDILKVESAWETWAADSGISRAVLAISYDGEIVDVVAIGAAKDAAFPLASLSKAITAACVQHIISSGGLLEKTTVEQILGAEFTLSHAAKTITVGQLLTHTSGLAPDSTQTKMGGWIGNEHSQHRTVSAEALSRAEQDGRPGKYFYSNENYAILAAIIEAVTRQSYERYCLTAVLVPAGITSARVSGKYAAFSGWGGWEASAGDFAKFVNAYFGKGSDYGERPDRFENAGLGGTTRYGLGTFYRESGSGYDFWHFGTICSDRGNTGSFFGKWQGKWSAVTMYDACLDMAQKEALVSVLSGGDKS